MAKIEANYRVYVRRHGADMDTYTFRQLYFARAAATNIKIPKALDAALLKSPISDGFTTAIANSQQRRTVELGAELFARRTLLTAAEFRQIYDEALTPAVRKLFGETHLERRAALFWQSANGCSYTPVGSVPQTPRRRAMPA
ncbi:hypothetical protein [Burkholderia stabilis]|uniref:hypothetical protein n=1 Tax=Burkholderia stabilis TaxID=95485 RepID=UPI00196AC662|nr:hypothetical protein [Burkholderia stabilis]